MKLSSEPGKNVLPKILDSLSYRWEDLTISMMEEIAGYLEEGGVFCKDLEEVLDCIQVMREMGLVDTISNKVSQDSYSYMIKRLFNGI